MKVRRTAATAPGRRPGLKLVAATCCICLLGALGNVMLPPTTAEAATASWTITPSPSLNSTGGQLMDVTCLNSTLCFGVGYSGITPLIVSWDGTTWSFVQNTSPSATAYGNLYSISCADSVDCVAVGSWGDPSWATTSYIQSEPLIEVWNGIAWSIAPSPNPFPNGGSGGNTTAVLYGVSCVSSTSCTAVGQIQSRPGYKTLIESWNGTAWSIVPSPNPNASITSNLNGGRIQAVSATTAAS
jgi:hypothetical protein